MEQSEKHYVTRSPLEISFENPLAKELHHIVQCLVVEVEAEQLRRLQDPVDAPWTTAVQALVVGGQSTEHRVQVVLVLQSEDLGEARVGEYQLLEAVKALLHRALRFLLKVSIGSYLSLTDFSALLTCSRDVVVDSFSSSNM